MASVQAKTGWVRPKKRKKKIIVLINSYPTHNRKYQKIAEKFKKLLNTIRDSLQAKTGWERPRKRENKNYCSDQFLPDP